jgi:hypothetical protein
MKFRFKIVKFSNFETPLPIFDAPSTPIELLLLINLRFNIDFHFDIPIFFDDLIRN